MAEEARRLVEPDGDGGTSRAVLDIEGMTCAMCVATVTEGLEELPGVLDVSVNLATAKAIVRFKADQVDLPRMIAGVKDRGYGVHTERVKLDIEGMTSATSVKTIEDTLGRLPGIASAQVNFATNAAFVDYSESSVTPAEMVRAIRAVGYGAAVAGEGGPKEDSSVREARHWRRLLWASGLLSLPLLVAMVLEMAGVRGPVTGVLSNYWLQLGLGSVVQFWPGMTFYVDAYYNLKHRNANMSVLVALGTSAAYLFSLSAVFTGGRPSYGTYFETSAVLITLVITGKMLEAIAKGRTSQAIRSLLGL